MTSLFCCDSTKPYKPTYTDHEAKFKAFMTWSSNDPSIDRNERSLADMKPSHAVQLVRQVNFGPLESKRYFVPVGNQADVFAEVTEDDLVQANFQKLNSYKNFKCDQHNKFFEINLYKENPVNKHHWRADIDRPASSIDL